jgi:hypothetical protein
MICNDMHQIIHRVDKHLYDSGFSQPQVRALVRTQLLVTMCGALALILAPLLGMWVMHFTIATLLMTYNFYALAKFVHLIAYQRFSRFLLVSLLVRVYGRLIVTGLALYVLVSWCHASLPALCAGLATVAITIVVWGLTQRLEQNVKEA